MKSEKLNYNVTDPELSYDTEAAEVTEQPIDEKRRRRILTIIMALAILVATLFAGFGIKKSRVDAVISDKAQDEMIESLSDYISQISGDYVSQSAANEIASNVIHDNFSDLLVSDFLNMDLSEISILIGDSIENYLEEYYNQEETEMLIQDAVDSITNLIMKDISGLQDQLQELKTSLENLTRDYEEYQKLMAENLNDMTQQEKDDVKRLETQIKDSTETLQGEIDVINDEIDIANMETPLISYIWNSKSIYLAKNKDGSDKIGVSNTEDWTIVGEKPDTSHMTIKEYVMKLMGNDNEFAKSINKLKDALNQSSDKINDEIDITNGELTSYAYNAAMGTDPTYHGGSTSNGVSDGTSAGNWHVVSKVEDTSNMTIQEYVKILAGNDKEFTATINKLYDYIEDSKDETYDYFNGTIADAKADLEEKLALEAEQRALEINNLNQSLEAYKDTIEQWQTIVDGQLGGRTLWTGTQAEYNALGTKDPNTIYFIVE